MRKRSCVRQVAYARHNAIRVGLSHVHGLSERSIRSIVEGRNGTEYLSFSDFMRKTMVKPSEGETLALCGALDNFGYTRPELLWRAKLWNTSFEKSSYLTDADFAVPSLPDYAEADKLNQEYEILSVSVKIHPIKLYKRSTHLNGVIQACDLHKHVGKTVKLVGWLVTSKRTRTVHGEYMKFLTLEDETDIFEVTLFPKVYKKYGHLLQSRGPYLVRGKVEDDGGSITVTAGKMTSLSQNTGRAHQKLRQQVKTYNNLYDQHISKIG